MARYSVYLMRTMSQVVNVEADTAAEAARKAVDENELTPNISNNFEEDGEVEVFNVRDIATDVVVYDSERDPTSMLNED
jgi:hypothetical protein